jgi:hypothetical protein
MVRVETLLTMTFFIKATTLDRAWLDLSDEEFFWEPTPGSWSVRRKADCVTSTPFGSGEWVVDYDSRVAAAADWRTVIEPPTTIAWLLWHVGSQPGRLAELDFLGGTKTAASGWTSPYLTSHPIFTSAAAAVTSMRDGWRALIGALRNATDEDLERPTEWWSYGEARPPATGAQVITSTLNEISHHGTQICMLRDLYHATSGPPLPPTR